MKNIKLILTIPLVLILFEACKPDKGCVGNNTYQYQPEEELNIVPYKDFSELTFINKITRDTSVFVGQGYVFDWGKYVTQEECPQTYNLQRRYIVFNCTKNTDKISIENTFLQPGNRTFTISYKNKSKSLNAGYFMPSFPFSYDSIIIENKYYYKVKKINPENSTTTIGYLYSLTKGLIQIVSPVDKDTLNLIDIKL